MTKRRKQPHDPALVARLQIEAAERRADEARLSKQPDVVVNTQDREKPMGQRVDVFDMMRERKALATEAELEAAKLTGLDPVGQRYNAVRELERKLAISMGVGDAVVSSGSAQPRGPLSVPTYLLIRIAATERLEALQRHMPRRDYELLKALLEPSLKGRVDPWRPIVLFHSGESNPVAQGVVLRTACKSLVDGWAALDFGERKAA